MKHIGIMLKDGTVKVIGTPELATENDSTSDEKIILELVDRISVCEDRLNNLYECRFEPDKLLIMLERYHKDL